MTLPASGQIGCNDINVELGNSGTAQFAFAAEFTDSAQLNDTADHKMSEWYSYTDGPTLLTGNSTHTGPLADECNDLSARASWTYSGPTTGYTISLDFSDNNGSSYTVDKATGLALTSSPWSFVQGGNEKFDQGEGTTVWRAKWKVRLILTSGPTQVQEIITANHDTAALFNCLI
jgi:hypothetical protein